MFKIFLFIFLFSLICNSLEYNNSKYLSFNDNFTYIYCNQIKEKNITNLNIYLGNDLIFLKISNPKESKDINITFDKSEITFLFKNKTYTYCYNRTKVYFLGDKNFLFVQYGTNVSENETYMTLDNNSLTIECGDSKATLTNVNYEILSADAEYLFIVDEGFSFVLALSGFFISLYGSYHYNISLVIHIFFLLTFFFCDIINFFTEVQLHIMFISFGFFVVSLSSSIFLKNNEISCIRQVFINIFYGSTLGFTLFKTIFYYLFYFLEPISFETLSDEWRFPIYFIVLIIFISIFTILNLCDVFGTYAYVPCSVIAGSFYVIKGLQYILGGYYSSILFLKKSLKFNISSKEKNDIILTYLILHLVILLFSSIFQIRYIKIKIEEIHTEELNRVSKLPRYSEGSENQNSRNNQSLIKEDDESLLSNKIKDDNDTSVNENNEIDDQED